MLKEMDKKKDCSSVCNSADENRDLKLKYKSPNDDPPHRAYVRIKGVSASPLGSSRNTPEELRVDRGRACSQRVKWEAGRLEGRVRTVTTDKKRESVLEGGSPVTKGIFTVSFRKQKESEGLR